MNILYNYKRINTKDAKIQSKKYA